MTQQKRSAIVVESQIKSMQARFFGFNRLTPHKKSHTFEIIAESYFY